MPEAHTLSRRGSRALLQAPDATMQAVLDLHNQLRAKHNVPALTWDASVAATAAQWASGCPRGHSGTNGVGENMAWGHSDFVAAVNDWYNEVRSCTVTMPVHTKVVHSSMAEMVHVHRK